MYGYDAQHRINSITQTGTGTTTITRDANGNVTSSTDELGRVTATAFDARNRVVSVTGPDPDGAGSLSAPVTTLGYDLAGNQTSVTDPLGRVRTTTFDARNRVVAQALPDPDGAGALDAPVTSYEYHLDGLLAKITDPLGNETPYVYDYAGRLIEAGEDPTVYEYDLAGQVVGVTDRNGLKREFTYNDLGLRTSETWLDAEEETVRVVTWAYDDAGQLIEASDPDSTYAFSYDLAGNVLSVDNAGTPNVPNVVLTLSYDYAGNRTQIHDNLNNTIFYGYTDHRLSSMQWHVDGTATAQMEFAYDDVGRPTEVVPNQIVGAFLAKLTL